MKLAFKIAIGVLMVAIVCSFAIFAFYTDFSKSNLKEKDTSEVSNDIPFDGSDIKPSDTDTKPSDSSIGSTDSTNKEFVLDGAYKMKSVIDFSSFPTDSGIATRNLTVGFNDGTEIEFLNDYNDLNIDNRGIYVIHYMGDISYIYNADSHLSTGNYEGKTFEYIKFYNKTVTLDDYGIDAYRWFVLNFEPCEVS